MPIVVAVTGCPGSGKTTVASAVAGDLGLPLLTRDSLKVGIGLSTATQDGRGGLDYAPEFAIAGGPYSQAAEEAMTEVGELLIRRQVSFVIETSVLPESVLARFPEFGARFVAIHTSASVEAIAARLGARAATGDVGATQLLRQLNSGQMNPDHFTPAASAVATIHIDTTLSAAPDVRPIIDAVHGALS